MEHEKAEIEKVREKIDNMTLDGVCSDVPDQAVDTSCAKQMENDEVPEPNLPEPPTMEVNSDHSNQTSVVTHDTNDTPDENVESSDWLNRMHSS